MFHFIEKSQYFARKSISAAAGLLISISLAACTTSSIETSFGSGFSRQTVSPINQPSLRSIEGSGIAGSEIIAGTDTFVQNTVNDQRPYFEEDETGDIKLNLVNAPLEAAVEAVLGDALDLTYAIDPDVSGRVTLQTTREMPKQLLLDTFTSILELHGATLDISGDLVSVIPLGTKAPRLTELSSLRTGETNIVIAPLQHVSASEMQSLIAPVVGNDVTMTGMGNRNLLVLTGSPDGITAAVEAINSFDVDAMRGKSFGIFKLETANPTDVINELNWVFSSGPGQASEDTIQFVASERLNAILAISSRAAKLEEAKEWIIRLDEAARSVNRHPQVYDLEYRSAEELAPILQQLVVVAPVSSSDEDSTSSTASQPAKIIADVTKNAVIVWGNAREQADIAKLIYELDSAPVQVLLEATIAEVTLTDELDFGLRWFFEEGNFSGTFSDAASGAVAQSFPGMSFLFQGPNAQAALNALASVTSVKIVASPSIMVADNAEAVTGGAILGHGSGGVVLSRAA